VAPLFAKQSKAMQSKRKAKQSKAKQMQRQTQRQMQICHPPFKHNLESKGVTIYILNLAIFTINFFIIFFRLTQANRL
jgi:hypothetical protein